MSQRPEPGADRRFARNRVRRGDERIGPDVDVEQRALRAFEEQVASGQHLGPQTLAHVLHERQDALGLRQAVVERALEIDRVRRRSNAAA